MIKKLVCLVMLYPAISFANDSLCDSNSNDIRIFTDRGYYDISINNPNIEEGINFSNDITGMCIPSQSIISLYKNINYNNPFALNANKSKDVTYYDVSSNVKSISFRKMIGLKYWKLGGIEKQGEYYLYNNRHTNKHELFRTNKDGRYGYLPRNQTSNNNWTFMGEMIVKNSVIAEKENNAAERAIAAFSSQEQISKEVKDSVNYKHLYMKNGNPGYGNYGYTLHYNFITQQDNPITKIEYREIALKDGYVFRSQPRMITGLELNRDKTFSTNAFLSVHDKIQLSMIATYKNGEVKNFRTDAITLMP